MIVLTQVDFTVAVNSSRQTVGAVRRGFETGRLIEIGYGTITLLEPAGLRGIVDQGADTE